MFKCSQVREAREVSFQALIGGETEPGRRQAAKVGKARGAGDALHVVEWDTGAVAGADQRADAGSRDTINRNTGTGQAAKGTDVRDATREPSGKRQTNTGALGRIAFLARGKGAKFVLSVAKPINGVRYFVFQHLALS